MKFINIFVCSAVAISLTFLSGCLPQEQAIDPASLSLNKGGDGNNFSGFSGLTSVETLSSSRLRLNWSLSTDPSVVAYKIYDSTDFLNPVAIATAKATENKYNFTGLTAQKLQTYRVRAVNSAGKEDSNVVDKSGIAYGGIVSYSIVNSSTVDINVNSVVDGDAVIIYCKVGLATVLDNFSFRQSDVTKSAVRLTGLTQGEHYSCRAAIEVSGVEDNNTNYIDFIPLGTASQLVFSSQPTNTNAGTPFLTQPVVMIKDGNGNTITAGPDSTALVTLTISVSSTTTGNLVGAVSVNAIGGVATFSGLSINESGLKILRAKKEDTSALTLGSGELFANSSPFTVLPGAVNASKSSIAITPAVPPNNALVADGIASYSVVITLKDQYENPITGVRPQFGTSKSGDTLTQPTQNTDSNGQTTGSITTLIADEEAPFRQLSITSPSGLSSVTTLAPFVAGPANKLAFTIQPANSPAGAGRLNSIKVAVQDNNGNIVRTGTNASSLVSLNITNNLNGAILLGTTSVAAVSGVATFSDLGIDRTGTGYRLIASSGSFITSLSNSFNMTAGTPQRIVVSGTASVISGGCSTGVTFQLQDNGGNAANALANTSVVISGLGGANLYTSPSCAGAALAGAPNNVTLTFTAGSNLRTLYLKSLKGEAVALSARDSSNVLTTGTRTIYVNPSKITLSAPTSVLSGACSTALSITPRGEDGNPAPLFSPKTVAIVPLGSHAKLYSDSSCTNMLVASAIELPVTAGTGSNVINVYLKDDKAETLNINVSDPDALMTTTSLAQVVNIGASQIGFTGPSSVIAGRCSTAYTVSLRDANGDPVVTSTNLTLNVSGLATTSGQFYLNPACTTGATKTAVTIPSGSSSISLYFSDARSELINVGLTNFVIGLAPSPIINITISPSSFQLKVVNGSPASSDTSACSSQLAVVALDGSSPPQATPAVTTLTALVSATGYAAGFGVAGKFYSDSNCTNQITSVEIPVQQTQATLYFKGQYPVASSTLTLSAVDSQGILSTGNLPWTVVAKKSWIGTLGTILDNVGQLMWFRTGVKPVASRMDSPSSVRHLYLDQNKEFLYVTDWRSHRIIKYDYINRRYVGWIGSFTNVANAAANVKGSNKEFYDDLPSPSSCIATTDNQNLPGWCVGGQSRWADDNMITTGGVRDPAAVVDDGTYIYVANYWIGTISRFNAASGAFDGWIGIVTSNPTGSGTGAPATCTTTSSGFSPGWCRGGRATSNTSFNDNWGNGNGGLRYPRALATDGTYLYVGQQSAVLRYHLATGQFAGWIGRGFTTAPTGGAPGCTSLGSGQQAPGWCMGGTYARAISASDVATGGIQHPVSLIIRNGMLYVVDQTAAGEVTRFDLTTGAFIQAMPNLAHNWMGAMQIALDPVSDLFYVADSSRVFAMDQTGTLQGWLGKVSNPPTAQALGNTQANSCTTLVANANTPGWCLGGLAKKGLDETSFVSAQAIVYDGSGNIIVGQYEDATIKIFNASTGLYGGTLVFSSQSPSEWINDSATFAELNGFSDHDYYDPMGSYSDGTFLYVVDAVNARIKKINLADGSLVGWIGGMTTTATGGSDPSCLLANAMSFTPAWCKGASPNPWITGAGNFMGNTVDGLMLYPNGITGDGTHLYVTDQSLHRILKFNAATGAYLGWIGRIQTSPTGGAAGCNGAAGGAFTPGWCRGGYPQAGNGDGMLNSPSGITYVAATGQIYVADSGNHRIVSYNTTTGAFTGWIGRIGTTPLSGCTPASNGNYNVSATGWCRGGTAADSGVGDRGGGFSFWAGRTANTGLSTDGTQLFVANFNNYRIDRFNLSGEWQGATQSRWDQYTNVWFGTSASDRTTVATWNTGGCGRARSIWVSGNTLYGVGDTDCAYWWGGGAAVFKMDLTSGRIIGWQGGINPIHPSYSPTAGETPSCVGATVSTPGWCQGGASIVGYKLGQFADARSLSGDAHFIYVTDINTHRVTRIPR